MLVDDKDNYTKTHITKSPRLGTKHSLFRTPNNNRSLHELLQLSNLQDTHTQNPNKNTNYYYFHLSIRVNQPTNQPHIRPHRTTFLYLFFKFYGNVVNAMFFWQLSLFLSLLCFAFFLPSFSEPLTLPKLLSFLFFLSFFFTFSLLFSTAW